MTPDVIAKELEGQGITFDADNSVDIFIKFVEGVYLTKSMVEQSRLKRQLLNLKTDLS